MNEDTSHASQTMFPLVYAIPYLKLVPKCTTSRHIATPQHIGTPMYITTPIHVPTLMYITTHMHIAKLTHLATPVHIVTPKHIATPMYIATPMQPSNYSLSFPCSSAFHHDEGHFLKHLATALSYKWDKAYSITSSYVRVRLAYAGVQAVRGHAPNGEVR